MNEFIKTIKKFPGTFWVANTMELFERWAWYGLFAVLALYLTQSTDTGALGFTQIQKGNMMGTVTAILYFLPLFTGALSDKFGFKRTLILAFLVLSSGYFMMGQFVSYGAVYFAFLWIALGAAMFKPIISGTVAKTTDETTSSIGFGLFYMIVNIGGFLGPIFSSKLRDAYGWKIVFIMSASAILVNLFLVLFFYKEPEREKSEISIWDNIKQALKNIYIALLDIKLTIFLIIMVGFWTMFNQLFYTLPNFIDQWVDTRDLYNWIHNISPALANFYGKSEGTVNPEMMVNLDAGFIIVFQLLISTLVMRLKPINAIISGILVTAAGIGLTFITANPFYTILGIFIFAIGEMGSSPKFTEYIGRIAPKDKTALYMGTSFLPVAAGNYITGYLSGTVYQSMSDKISLLKLEVVKRGLELPEISSSFTQNQYMQKAAELMGTDEHGLTKILWENYHPQNIWMIFSAIGIATVVALFFYDKLILKNK